MAATQNAPIAVSSPDSSVRNGQVTIAGVYWYQPQTIADTFVVQDDSGNTIIPGYCEVANQSQFIILPAPIFCPGGYKVSTLASGTLYVLFNN